MPILTYEKWKPHQVKGSKEIIPSLRITSWNNWTLLNLRLETRGQIKCKFKAAPPPQKKKKKFKTQLWADVGTLRGHYGLHASTVCVADLVKCWQMTKLYRTCWYCIIFRRISQRFHFTRLLNCCSTHFLSLFVSTTYCSRHVLLFSESVYSITVSKQY
jgi:hypothetical protein